MQFTRGRLCTFNWGHLTSPSPNLVTHNYPESGKDKGILIAKHSVHNSEIFPC